MAKIPFVADLSTAVHCLAAPLCFSKLWRCQSPSTGANTLTMAMYLIQSYLMIIIVFLPGISLATTDGAVDELLAICWWLIMWQHWGTALLTMYSVSGTLDMRTNRKRTRSVCSTIISSSTDWGQVDTRGQVRPELGKNKSPMCNSRTLRGFAN